MTHNSPPALHTVCADLSEEARKLKVMDRFVTRWRNAGLMQTLNSWIEVRERGRVGVIRSCKARSGLRLHHSRCCCEFVAETQRLRTLVSKMLRRMEHTNHLKALMTWKAYLKALEAEDFRKVTLSRYALRWRNSGLLRMLNVWVYFTSESIRMKTVVTKVFHKMDNRERSSALLTWRAYLESGVAFVLPLLSFSLFPVTP